MANMRDAMNMALKLVSNYGLSEKGLTMYVPDTTVTGFMNRAFEVCGLARLLAGLGFLSMLAASEDDCSHDHTRMYVLLFFNAGSLLAETVLLSRSPASCASCP